MSSAQISVYGVGEGNLNAAVDAALAALVASGLPHSIGPMSTVVDSDDDGALFAALAAAYRAALACGPVVMHITVSNACPVG